MGKSAESKQGLFGIIAEKSYAILSFSYFLGQF